MLLYTTIILGIIIDLLSKKLASIYLLEKINLIGDFLYLKYILNPGIAFGIELNSLILKILTIILIIGIFYYYLREEKKKKNKFIDLSFGLILAGAIGNAYERIFNSQVIDFIGIKYFSIFNLADTYITIGAILYLFIIYKNN